MEIARRGFKQTARRDFDKYVLDIIVFTLYILVALKQTAVGTPEYYVRQSQTTVSWTIEEITYDRKDQGFRR